MLARMRGLPWLAVAVAVAVASLAVPAAAGAALRDVVPANPAGARQVPIVGGSPTDVRVVRAVLAQLGPDWRVIPRIRFERRSGPAKPRPRLIVEQRRPRPGSRPSSLAKRQAVRDIWLYDAFVREAAAALKAAGRPVAGFFLPPVRPTRTRAELAALADRIRARGAALGVAIPGVRVDALGGGLVRVRARFTERQFLMGEPGDLHTRLIEGSDGSDETYRAHIELEAPDGTPYEHLGADPPRSVPAPAGLGGPTRLEITVERPDSLTGDVQRTRFALACDGAASEGIADPVTLCRRLIGERYVLVPPASNITCSPPVDSPSILLHGTVLGVTVDRHYGACERYFSGVGLWLRLLGVPG